MLFITLGTFDLFSHHCFIFLYFQTRTWRSFDATFVQGHTLQCPGVAIKVHTCLLQNGQAGRLNKKMSLLTLPTDSTLGRECLLSIHKLAISKDCETYPKRMKQSSLICTTKNGMITMMLLAEMEKVYKAEVEAVLYHHKPLECLIDPMVIAALTLWHPPMKSLVPQNTATINSKYVVPIDIATISELVIFWSFSWDGNRVVWRCDSEQEANGEAVLHTLLHRVTLYMRMTYYLITLDFIFSVRATKGVRAYPWIWAKYVWLCLSVPMQITLGVLFIVIQVIESLVILVN